MDPDDLQAPRFHVDFNEVALFHKGDGPSCCRLRADMPDDRSAGRTGEAAVGNQRDTGRQLRIGADRLAGIEHLRHAGASRALIADEDGIAGLDLAVEHRVNAGFLAVIRLRSQRGPEHVLRTGRVLDDAAFRCQISAQDGDAAVGALGVVEVVDDVGA